MSWRFMINVRPTIFSLGHSSVNLQMSLEVPSRLLSLALHFSTKMSSHQYGCSYGKGYPKSQNPGTSSGKYTCGYSSGELLPPSQTQ